MISDSIKSRVRRDLEPVGLLLASTGLTANVVTWFGLLLNVVVALVVATGHVGLGGWFLLPVAAFDMLDGAVARATKGTTTFGAFLDSTLDRYAEALIFVALLIVYSPSADVFTNAIIVTALAGSMMVSYTRARAEGLGLRCEVGLLPRPERIVILALGLIAGWTVLAVAALAILTNLTAAQRIHHVWKLTKGK